MNKKNINEIVDNARRGNNESLVDIVNYLQSFSSIILRGAGNFGSAFGAFLVEEGIKKQALCYWDIRAKEIKEKNGIRVIEPFSIEGDKNNTLIINCIPNGSLSEGAGEKHIFLSKGYSKYLSGMALFEALMCKMKAEKGFDGKVCIDTTFCNWCACKRLPSLLQKQCKQQNLNAFTDELVFPLATFVVNQKCTLSCTHCGQYINHYQKKDRVNFLLEAIKSDIDKMFNAVDVIGYVSIIGGEPFMHAQLDAVIDHVLGKPNFGVIGITTNGVCDISDEFLYKYKESGKVRIIFSDYTRALSENQEKLFNKNVQKVKDVGISYTVGEPIWETPVSLRKLGLTKDEKIQKKLNCNAINTCKTIQNGVYYPCTTTAGIGSHHMEDFSNDWVKLEFTLSAEQVRENIKKVDAQPYYESCDYCGEGAQLLEMSGEQGVSELYQHVKIVTE